MSAEAFLQRGRVFAFRAEVSALDGQVEPRSATQKSLLLAKSRADYHSAVTDYTKALEINPKLSGAYNVRGLAYAALKDHDSAIADYTRAIELNPNEATLYYNRGAAYTYMKSYDKAIADLTKSIERAPALNAGLFNATTESEKQQWVTI